MHDDDNYDDQCLDCKPSPNGLDGKTPGPLKGIHCDKTMSDTFLNRLFFKLGSFKQYSHKLVANLSELKTLFCSVILHHFFYRTRLDLDSSNTLLYINAEEIEYLKILAVVFMLFILVRIVQLPLVQRQLECLQIRTWNYYQRILETIFGSLVLSNPVDERIKVNRLP